MPTPLIEADLDEAELTQLAGRLAVALLPGDCVALRGDLGAGKTTLARALIRAFVADLELEVPSPTFALRQDYVGPRGAIVHFDLYRIAAARDLDEIGFEEALVAAVVLVEWPERAGASLPAGAIEVTLRDCVAADRRHLSLVAHGPAAERMRNAIGTPAR